MGFLNLIPLPWKLAGIALIALSAFGAYEGWAYHERTLGAAKVEAADAKALAKQKADDAALSAEIVAKQQLALSALEAKANTSVVRYVNAPKTNGCGPVMRDASHSVRDLLGGRDAAKP